MLREIECTINNNVAVKFKPTKKIKGPRFFWCSLKATQPKSPTSFQTVLVDQPKAITSSPAALSAHQTQQLETTPYRVQQLIDKYNGRPYDYGCCFICLCEV